MSARGGPRGGKSAIFLEASSLCVLGSNTSLKRYLNLRNCGYQARVASCSCDEASLFGEVFLCAWLTAPESKQAFVKEISSNDIQ